MASFFDRVPAQEPSAGNAFAGNPIDRRSEERTDESIPTAYADPAARLYLFQGDKAILRAGRGAAVHGRRSRGAGLHP